MRLIRHYCSSNFRLEPCHSLRFLNPVSQYETAGFTLPAPVEGFIQTERDVRFGQNRQGINP